MRRVTLTRKSKETSIIIDINLDGTGNSEIQTPIGFLTHMLDAFTRHSLIDMKVEVSGDMEVDQHHTVEDLGFMLGKAINSALGDRIGISRAGYFVYPMDEALALCAIDLSGRPYLQFQASFKRQFCGDFDTDLLEHFFEAVARGAGMNIVIRLLAGENDHHKLEAIFKAFARALREAISIEPRLEGIIPSSKEVLDL